MSNPKSGSVTVKEGESVSVECDVSGNPAPEVTWSKMVRVSQGCVTFYLPTVLFSRAVFFLLVESVVRRETVTQLTMSILNQPESLSALLTMESENQPVTTFSLSLIHI